MGQSSEITLPDRKRIMAKRLFNIDYRQVPSDEERDIISLDDELFLEELRKLDLKERYKGLQFVSPEGLPGVKYMDGVKYTRLQSFNFTVDLDKHVERSVIFTFRGIEVRNFQVCRWGGSAPEGYLAFGTGLINDDKLMFYQKKGSKMLAHRIELMTGSTLCGTDKVSWIRGIDLTPISFMLDEMPGSRLNLSGDPIGLLNYGNFIKTKSGVDYFCKLFEMHNSVFPYYLRSYLPDYPCFVDPVELGSSKSYIIEGYHTTKIKLLDGAMPPALVDARSEDVTVELLNKVVLNQELKLDSWDM
jgi:hypothetical protein